MNSSRGSSPLFSASSIAGRILRSRPVSLPSSTPSHAPFTAPQPECPKTTISLEPASLQANSIEPTISSFNTFPAMRILKISPSPWSKISSADVRESMQLRMTAKGYCPSAVMFACSKRLRLTLRFAWKRAFPSLNSSRALWGVNAACVSLVWVLMLSLSFES